ncbi:MAG: thioredoxin family protein [Candidatus Calescibacterium sp.]|nr:thioredoxin family protein [Candidatus Calescibacterium sp.]MCX7972044.1 thioredoxin family protein [bacterium]MDW8194672.1 thioredoxin family protein [Candidatus Calescibacterium sp.]
MFLTDEDKAEIKKQLGDLKNEFELILFSQKIGCTYCSQAEQLLKELNEVLPRMKLSIFNPVLDEEVAAKYQVGRDLPVIAINSAYNPRTMNVKFLGIPLAYEFTWLISLINMVGNDIYPLQQSTLKTLAEIDDMLEKNSSFLELLVFVTPTCPYCPVMSIISTAFALLSKNIKTICIEVSEFPEFAQKYSVIGVPKTVIRLVKGDQTVENFIEGATPENKFSERLHKFVSSNLLNSRN